MRLIKKIKNSFLRLYERIMEFIILFCQNFEILENTSEKGILYLQNINNPNIKFRLIKIDNKWIIDDTPDVLKNAFDFLHEDLLITIFEKLDFESQINLKKSCHNFYTKLQITNLVDLSKIFREKLTDEILSSDQFRKVKKLNIKNNKKITDGGIKNLTKLQELNISNHFSKITDEGIRGLINLHILNAEDNS